MAAGTAEWLTIEETANRLGCHYETLRLQLKANPPKIDPTLVRQIGVGKQTDTRIHVSYVDPTWKPNVRSTEGAA